jgi:DNA-binding MarR family transcriptional regulator
MSSKTAQTGAARRRRQRLSTDIKYSLRQLSIQLSLLNHHVGAHVNLNQVDLNCLDLIARHGPLSPSALGQLAGLHPATVTGILDRLEAGGWVARARAAADRRAVLVRVLHDRNAELLQLYSGMNAAMDELCAGYTEAELELLAEFVQRVANSSRSATHALVSAH